MSPSESSSTGFAKTSNELSNELGNLKLPKPDIDMSSVVMPADTTNFDFLGTLDEMQKNIKSDENQTGNGLSLDEGLSPKVLTGLVSDKFVDADQKLLEEADRLIRQKKYTKAIEVLDKLLEGSPYHHQALYMKALCYASKEGKGVEEKEIALEILLPLTKARLEGTLETKVRILRERVKKEMLLYVMIEQLLILRTNMRKNVISRLQRLIKLVPEEPIYHFIFSGTLMMEEQYAEAIEVVDEALEELPKKNSGMLLKLRAEIIRRQVDNALKPVLAAFKKEQYSEAHKKLKSLDKSIRKNPIYVIFDNYLKDQQGGFFSRMYTSISGSFWPVYITSTVVSKSVTASKSVAKNIMPRGGSKEDIEQFYFFICGDELKKGQKYIMSRDASRAEKVLRQVVEKWAPAFPYANYLCAAAIYFRLLQYFETQQVPPLEEAIADLETTVEMIKIGQQDPKIKDIHQLSKAVDSTWDALLLKPVVKKYNDVMKGAKDGIRSTEQYEKVSKIMTQVLEDIESLRGKVKNPKNKELMEKLHKAASANLNQLKSMEGEMETAAEAELVKKNYDQFESIVKLLKNPVKPPEKMQKRRGQFGLLSIDEYISPSLTSPWDEKKYQLELIMKLREVPEIRDSADRDRRGMKNPQARKAMDDLIEQLDQILGMINR